MRFRYIRMHPRHKRYNWISTSEWTTSAPTQPITILNQALTRLLTLEIS